MTPVRREGYKFLQDICVPCYFTDASFSLKPSSFMDICQEIAYWAASELGFGYDDLNVHHTAWVLSRMHFRISKYPKWRDNVTIYTWHKGAEGLFYLRDFQLKDAEGEIIASSTSSWLVIDTRTRHIVREGEVFSTLDGSRVNDNAIEEQAPKVVLPKGIEPELVKEHTVSYSDIDIIGHTNNARYMVWAMDAIDYESVSSKRVKDVYINFNKETLAGEKVSIFRVMTEEEGREVYYLEGRVDGRSAFTVKIVF